MELMLKVPERAAVMALHEAPPTVGRSQDRPKRIMWEPIHERTYFVLALNQLLFLQPSLFVCKLHHFNWYPGSGTAIVKSLNAQNLGGHETKLHTGEEQQEKRKYLAPAIKPAGINFPEW